VEGIAKAVDGQGTLAVEVHGGAFQPVTVETLRRLRGIE